MASVLKLDPQREAAAILRDIRAAMASDAAFQKRRHSLTDAEVDDWCKAADRIDELRAELDATVLETLGVGLDQIKEAIGC